MGTLLVNHWYVWLIFGLMFWALAFQFMTKRRARIEVGEGSAMDSFAPMFFLAGFGTLNMCLFLSAMIGLCIRHH
jgi:hypothetical protein